MEIITRKKARLAGLKRYFTGKPCPQGHNAARYVCSSTCVICETYSVAKQKWRAAHRDHIRAYMREYMRRYYQLHKEKFQKIARDNYAKKKAQEASLETTQRIPV